VSINNEPLVLIADDLPKVIDFYKQLLIKKYDISTVSATTLDELDEVFDRFIQQIDLVILDGCIPGNDINTIEFIERARARGFTKPIIAASSLPEYRMQMVDAGCSHETEKEFAPELASWILKGL